MARSTRRPIRPNPLMATFTVIASSSFVANLEVQPLFDDGGDRVWRYAEMPVKILVRSGGAKPVHADEDSFGADPSLPTEAAGRLDAEAGDSPENLGAVGIILQREQLPAGQRDY